MYAAGAVLYEMATGRRPFNATNDAALMNAILRGKPNPPTETNPHISPGLNAIVLKALDLDPSLRYQSATELQVDLNRLSGRAHETIRPGRRNWKVAAAVLIASGILAVGLVVWWPVSPTAPLSRSTGPTAPDAQIAPTTGSRLRVELTPAEVIGPIGDASQWPRLIHALLSGELAGIQEISLLDSGPEQGTIAERRESGGGADLVVRMRVLTVGMSRELQCSVIEAPTKEISFSARTAVASEAQLTPAVRELSGALSAFFHVRSSGPEYTRDLRPWISSRPYKAEAVTAFVHGAMYVFRYQPDAPRRHFQRALEIEPNFVAPRIWRLPTFLEEGKGRAEIEYLRSIEAQASPFEQSMIAFAGALADGNVAAQARHLEVALKYAPGNRILLSSLASVQEKQGDCRAALDTLRPLVEGRWDYAPLYSQWGRCAIDLGLIDEARRPLEASLTLAPPHPAGYALLDGLAILRGDTEASARYGSLLGGRLKDLGGSLPAQVRSLARLYDRVGRHALRTDAFAQAAVLFEKAAQLDPSEPGYHDRLADALDRLGRTRESRQERSRAQILRRRSR